MCSKFEGDLADIIRGSGGGGNGNTMMASTTEEPVVDPTWQFPSNAMGRRLDGFGDPFPNMQDPLLQDLDTPISPPPFFTTTTNNNITSHISINESNVTNSIFSSMGYEMTCSSVDKLQSGTSIVVASGDMINNNNSGSSNDRHHVMETQVLQISSPRNTGIKRRKSQAKKVVCIPAPAPVNSSRQSGEVVPSDLWAWRKYGQKPIKGSPYPRGYYRCSSSKGCSARKQVERSRTDPNMLVITYTCEHNHPWPTQRNALAGSTRSSPHTSKNTSSSSSSSALHTSPSSSSFSHPNPIHNTNTTTATTTNTIPKDENEGKKESNSITSSHECGNVKEEETVIIMEQRAEMETHITPAFATQTYRPTLPDESNYYNHSEDFFAELGEIEADPLNLLFENNEENNNNNKQSDAALDPFGFYDWAAENNNDCGGLLLGGEETKGGVQQNP